MTNTIKNDFNEKELKSQLTSLKENATKVESISTISAICTQLVKYIKTKNSPTDDQFNLPIKTSELTKYCFELVGYDRKVNRNSTFENIVGYAITTACISISPKYEGKQNYSFEKNTIEISSKYKTPFLNSGLKKDKTIDWQENKSNTMVELNLADLLAINKDLKKASQENRKKRQIKEKQNQNLGRKIMLGFNNLSKDLIDNFNQSKSGGDVWNNKLILEKIGKAQLEDFEKNLNVIISFVQAVKTSHNSTDNEGNYVQVSLPKIREKYKVVKVA